MRSPCHMTLHGAVSTIYLNYLAHNSLLYYVHPVTVLYILLLYYSVNIGSSM